MEISLSFFICMPRIPKHYDRRKYLNGNQPPRYISKVSSAGSRIAYIWWSRQEKGLDFSESEGLNDDREEVGNRTGCDAACH